MTASDLVIRPVGPDERAAWEPLWNGYLTFYESSVTKEIDRRSLETPARSRRADASPRRLS